MRYRVLHATFPYLDEDGVRHEHDKGQVFDGADVPKDRLEFGLEIGAIEKADGKASTSDDAPSYPGTHAELDALADANGVEWPAGTKTVADKHAALTAAGVEPE